MKEDIKKEEEVKEEKKQKRRPEPEGSRWGAFILLIITLLISVGFYIKGVWGKGGSLSLPKTSNDVKVLR